jgi:hypothetical protein
MVTTRRGSWSPEVRCGSSLTTNSNSSCPKAVWQARNQRTPKSLVERAVLQTASAAIDGSMQWDPLARIIVLFVAGIYDFDRIFDSLR